MEHVLLLFRASSYARIYIYVIGLIIDFKVTFELAAIRMVFLFFFWPHKQVLGG